ncbi:MAG TPA: 2-oxoacid:ferredoxin oxidoreductase subunit gamma [Firmicutes bacterium]|nr:2-oxoacid:ferredoxin oxidoreductase subunit gamma [Bacillota bacterium]HBK61359.1 2-oxoacid:ferredoxin oxidoreductase subunit gamma [Bacillota bacterium]
MRREIRLSGYGGQGLILAGIILAEAAMHDGHEAVQTQSYGPEARGGASKAEVIISDEPIDYPKVTAPDVLLLMSEAACKRYACTVEPGGAVIVDSGLVENVPSNAGVVYKIPVTDISVEATGRAITANIAALGVVNSVAKLVSPESLERAVAARVPRGTAEANLNALRAGMAAAQEAGSRAFQRE